MKLKHHALFSAALSGALVAAFKSWELALSSFVLGVFVDVDHVLDYFIQFGPRFRTRHFFDSFSIGMYDRIYIPLHGWEWSPLLAALTVLTGWNVWVLGAFIGFTLHMLIDQLTNGAGTFGYSLVWRACAGFDPAAVFPHDRKWTDRRATHDK